MLNVSTGRAPTSVKVILPQMSITFAVLAMVALPHTGEKIPAGKFHVSPTNVRARESFGQAPEDLALIENLKAGQIIGPFKARPEEKGYGVFMGRRRFLAKCQLGAVEFVVGKDVLIENIGEDDAREASLIENLEILRKTMDPVARARQLLVIVKNAPDGLRGTAKKLGLSHSTLSEWLKILDLSPKMQLALTKELIYFTDGLNMARLDLPRDTQDRLAGILETDGADAFRRALNDVDRQNPKPGLPAGKFMVLRTLFDRRKPDDVKLWQKIEQQARDQNMAPDDYVKWFLTQKL